MSKRLDMPTIAEAEAVWRRMKRPSVRRVAARPSPARPRATVGWDLRARLPGSEARVACARLKAAAGVSDSRHSGCGCCPHLHS